MEKENRSQECGLEGRKVRQVGFKGRLVGGNAIRKPIGGFVGIQEGPLKPLQ